MPQIAFLKPELFKNLSNPVRFINLLLWEAFENSVSDLHLEMKEAGFEIRYRQFGRMKVLIQIGLETGEQILARLRVLCHMESTHKFHIQEARILEKDQLPPVNIRISFLPTLWGEKAALRLLAREIPFDSLEKLGCPKVLAQQLEQILNQDRGLFLICGATGSGKTTTLYTWLQQVSAEKNLLCFEDPIEYVLPQASQTPVQLGLSYEQALRAALRQDPDLILIGEIRDSATLILALEAALAGHLILSTFHAGSVLDAWKRLSQWVEDPELLQQGLTQILHQKLTFEQNEARLKWEFWKKEKAVFSEQAIQYLYP